VLGLAYLLIFIERDSDLLLILLVDDVGGVRVFVNMNEGLSTVNQPSHV